MTIFNSHYSAFGIIVPSSRPPYPLPAMLHFAGLKLDRLPDETTIHNFRHFLEHHGLGKVLFKEVNKHLEKNGLTLREGSIVDATVFILYNF